MMTQASLWRAEITKITRRVGRSLAARDSGPSYLLSTRRIRVALLVGILIAAVCGTASNAPGQTSQWVFVGPDGKLAYKALPKGDRIMDFSFAGYKGGGVALPVVHVVQTVSPSGQDDTAAIKAALDAVSGRSPDANGIRAPSFLPRAHSVAAPLCISLPVVSCCGAAARPQTGPPSI